MENKKIAVFDSTLRDGSQGEGISYSVQDKINIAKALDELGVTFIEAGNPGSNPKDMEFFVEAKKLELKNSNLVVSEARNFINSLKFDKIVLTSGVPTTMVALRKNLSYESYQSDLINGENLEFGEFDFWLERILNFSETEAILKLGENRKDLMIAGIMLFKSLLQDFAKTEFVVVDDGLREGICITAIRELNPA